MNKEGKRNRRFKLIMAVRIVAILIALVNLYLLLTGKFSNDNGSSIEKEVVLPPNEQPQKETQQPVDSASTYVSDNKRTRVSKSAKTTTESKQSIEIQKLVQYKGIPIEGAYFKVSNCTGCTSSFAGKDGIAKANIPKHLFEKDKEFDFYVYRADTLLYQKSMRFSDLQFNSYQ